MKRYDSILTGQNPANKIYDVDVQDIIDNWITGDYIDDCEHQLCADLEYQECQWLSNDNDIRVQRWNDILKQTVTREHYSNIVDSIINYGFIAPLTAKVGYKNKYIVFMDGHHRLQVALDLGIKTVPVFIGGTEKDRADLVAMDSNWWRGGDVDSPVVHMLGLAL